MRLCLACLALAATSLAGQVDPSGTYRTLTTEHFRVHFRPAHRATATAAAREAERAFALLSEEMSPPRGTVDLLLVDDADVSNAFATVVPSNRITVFLPPPTRDGIADFDDWLRLVIVHELVHVFHLDRARGPWGVLQTVFGRLSGTFPNAYQPSWVVEGLATYYESRFTTAGRINSSFHRQLMRGELLAQHTRPPHDATAVDIRWPAGHAAYAYGGQFFDRVASAHGTASVGAFVERTSGQWIPVRVGRPLVRTTGDDLLPTWNDGLEPLRGDTATTGSRRVLTQNLLVPSSPAVNARGDRLAYVHDDGITPRRLVVLDLESGRRLASRLVNGSVELAWHGDTVLVSQLDWRGLYQVRDDLYAWVPGGAWRRLTRGVRLTAPAAGGGRTVAVRRAPGSRAPVWVASDGSVTPIAVPDSSSAWAEVVPSRDGRLLAGVRHREGRWDLIVWQIEGPGAVRSVTQDAAIEAAPVWAADGTLLFTSDRTGLPQIYRWDPTSERLTQLTDHPNGAREGAIDAVGQLLYETVAGRGRALIAEQLRPARAPGVAPARPAPETAPEISVRESPYRPWQTLLPRYWLPYGSLGDAGTFLGALTSATDVLGRTSYAVGVAVDVDRGRLMGVAALQYARLGRPVFDLGFTQSWSALFDPQSQTEFGLRERDAALGVTWHWRRWRSALSLRVAAEYEQDALDPAVVAARSFVGGSVTVGVTRTVTPSLAISRERGFELLATYRRRERLQSSGWSNEWRARGAVFLPSVWPSHVVAVRAAAGLTGGSSPPRFEVGGVSSQPLPLVAGVRIGGRRSFPVRGYPAASLLGTRVVSATVEYRAPLFYVGRNVASLPIGLTRVSGALFGDLGGAWDADEPALPDAMVSTGAEAWTDGTVVYDFVLRVRVGVAVALKATATVPAGRTTAYLAFGTDF